LGPFCVPQPALLLFKYYDEKSKQPFIDCLDWLEEICPLAYRFKNCELGYKFLFNDGIYGEFAVFEPEELNSALYTGLEERR